MRLGKTLIHTQHFSRAVTVTVVKDDAGSSGACRCFCTAVRLVARKRYSARHGECGRMVAC